VCATALPGKLGAARPSLFVPHGLQPANGPVTDPSRNDGAFSLILSEMARQNRHFCAHQAKDAP
jgi:hypothetical protein